MRALRALPFVFALAGASIARAPLAHAGGGAPAEAPLSDAESAAVLTYFNELVDTVVKHREDCGALATATNGVVDRHMATLQMSWAAQKAKRKPSKKVTAQLDKRAVEMVGALKKCWDDAAVKAAFKRMKPPKEDKK